MKKLLISGFCLLLFAALLTAHHCTLRAIPPSRVEVVGSRQSIEPILAVAQARDPDLAPLTFTWTEDRLCVIGADGFTAQRMNSLLTQAGLPPEDLLVVDYSWAGKVLAQSLTLWRFAAAVLALWLLCRGAVRGLGREAARLSNALSDMYFADYLWTHGVRLMLGAILLAVGAITALLLLRWLWQAPLVLPWDLLPAGSIFDVSHYRQWLAATFPEGAVSSYGLQLRRALFRTALLTGGECAVLLLLVITNINTKRRKEGEST